MELKRVVVTGLGAVTPVGNNPEETWKNLVNGVSGAAPITQFDCSKCKTHFACEVKNLDVTEYIDRKEARKMDRYTQLAIIAADQAVTDSGMDLTRRLSDLHAFATRWVAAQEAGAAKGGKAKAAAARTPA